MAIFMTITDYEVIRKLTRLEQQMDMTTDADEFDELRLQSEHLMPFAMAEVVVFKQNGKYGLKTESKREGYQPSVVEEAIYDHIEIRTIKSSARTRRQRLIGLRLM